MLEKTERGSSSSSSSSQRRKKKNRTKAFLTILRFSFRLLSFFPLPPSSLSSSDCLSSEHKNDFLSQVNELRRRFSGTTSYSINWHFGNEIKRKKKQASETIEWLSRVANSCSPQLRCARVHQKKRHENKRVFFFFFSCALQQTLTLILSTFLPPSQALSLEKKRGERSTPLPSHYHAALRFLFRSGRRRPRLRWWWCFAGGGGGHIAAGRFERATLSSIASTTLHWSSRGSRSWAQRRRRGRCLPHRVFCCFAGWLLLHHGCLLCQG